MAGRRSEYTRTTARADRSLYILHFGQRRIYVGQTKDPKRRWGEHRRSGWAERPASMSLVLVAPDSTEVEAEDLEHAIRLAAHWLGYAVFSQPPGLVIRRMTQLTWRRRWMAWKLLGKVRRVLRGATCRPPAS